MTARLPKTQFKTCNDGSVVRYKRRCPFPPTFVAPSLNALSLSANSINEGAANGAVVGAILNATAGSTLTLSDSAGGRFKLSGHNLVASALPTDFETATSHSVTIVETLHGATGSPRSTVHVINVVNLFEQPSLTPLTFSATTFVTALASSGTIIGATAGSTITASGLPAGLTIDGAARTWAWDGTGSIATSSFTLTETLADSANSPRASTISYAISATPGILQVLTLSSSSIAENSAAGTMVGAIQNVTAGSALSLSDSAGSRFALSGSNIVAGATATNYESATTHNITIVETLAGATGSPKSTTVAIGVTNVFEQANLAALAFSSTTFATSSASSGTINNATATSTVTASGLPSGLTIDGAARTWAWDGTGALGSGSFTLTETLSDSANSPRVTTISYTIAAAGTLATPTLTNYSTLGAAPVTLMGSTADYVAGLRGQLQVATDAAFTSITQNLIFFIDGASWASNDEAIGLVTPNGLYYARWRIVRDNESGATSITDSLGNTFTADVSSWSTTFTDTTTGTAAAFSTVTGPEKSVSITPTGTPALTYQPNSSTNSATSVRMDRAQFNDAWHIEYEVVSFDASGTVNLVFGVIEGPTTPSLASPLSTFPGNSGSGKNGFSIFATKANTNFRLRRNGGSQDIALPGGTPPVAGDRFILEYKHSTKRLDTWFYRAATGITTAMHVNVVLTSLIPTSVYLFGTAYRLGDQATIHLDPAQFMRAATTGYSFYA